MTQYESCFESCVYCIEDSIFRLHDTADEGELSELELRYAEVLKEKCLNYIEAYETALPDRT